MATTINLDSTEAKQNISFSFVFYGPIGEYEKLREWAEKNLTSTRKYKTWAPYPLYVVGQRDYMALQKILRKDLEVEKKNGK